MILLWLILWFWYDFDMVLIWLIFRALTLSQEPYVFSHPHHNNTKGPSPIPSCAMFFFLGSSFLRVWDPPPPRVRRSTGNPQQRTNTEPGSPRSSRILNPGIWTAVILSHKHRKIKSYISVSVIRVWLASSPLGHVGSFWEVLAHRSEKPERGKKLRGSWLGCLSF